MNPAIVLSIKAVLLAGGVVALLFIAYSVLNAIEDVRARL